MPGGQFGRIARRLRDLEEIDAQVGAGHAERAIVEDDVVRRRFQKMRGELGALLDDRAPGLVKRRAADGNGARAAGQPRRRAVGVAHDHVDAVGVDAELVRYQLLVRGDETGAVFLAAHDQLDAVVP